MTRAMRTFTIRRIIASIAAARPPSRRPRPRFARARARVVMRAVAGRESVVATRATRSKLANRISSESARSPTLRRRARGDARTATITCAVRPYTVRKGDTLESIASKRSMSVGEVKKYNKSLRGEGLAPGTTILLPANRVSKRDQEIIDGIRGVNEPRVYPCREGESLNDIIEPRKISKAEVERLNPKLGALKSGTKVLLPPGKYTVREKEMLQGCGILPAETLNPLAVLGTPVARNALGAMIGLGAYAMYWAACKRYQDHGTKLWGNDREEINQD